MRFYEFFRAPYENEVVQQITRTHPHCELPHVRLPCEQLKKITRGYNLVKMKKKSAKKRRNFDNYVVNNKFRRVSGIKIAQRTIARLR